MGVTKKDKGKWVCEDLHVLDDLVILGDITLTGSITISGDFAVGESGTGSDFTAYGDTAGCNMAWDASADTNHGTLSLGSAGGSKGTDFIVYGAANGNYFKWDQSADDLLLVGTSTQLAVAGDTDSSSISTGSIHTAGGVGVSKTLYVGTGADITGNLAVDGTTVVLDGSTSTREISAGFTSHESPANRFGSDANVYMQVATTATSGITAITHTGNGVTVTWTAPSFDFVGTMALDATTVSGVLSVTDATAASALTTASLKTAGGLGVTKNMWIGQGITMPATVTGTLFDFVLETEWTTGTLINADVAVAGVTLSGDITGLNFDFATNITAATDHDVTAFIFNTPALTQVAANTTSYKGFYVESAGALSQTTAAGTLNWDAIDLVLPVVTCNFGGATVAVKGFNIGTAGAVESVLGTASWRGLNVQMPNLTQTGGSALSYGLYITGGTYTSGTEVGINIGAITTGINFSGAMTTGINFAGGNSYNPIHIGVKSNTADDGLILTGATDDTGGMMIFVDDGGDALGSVTSPIWTRYLITANQGAGGPTATGMFAQIKSLTGLTFATGSYTAFKAYNQVGGTLVLDGANTEVGIINAGITFEGDLTVTNGTASGIDVNIDDNSHTIGTISALLVRKVSASTLGWTYGLKIDDAGAATGINIGACSSYGILMDGTYTNAIRITTDVDTTAHTGIRLLNTYTAADGYHVGIMGAAIWNPTAASGYGAVIGVYGEANIQGDFTGGTNWSFGVRGTLQLTDDTVINNASSVFGAINASMKDDATPTLTAGHICGIYIENLIDADLSSITGISSMLYMANNASATCTIDSGIYLYGPKVTYFAQFYDCTVAGCIAASAGSSASKYIKVDVDGTPYKIELLADS